MKFEKYGIHIGVVKSKTPLFSNEKEFIDFLIQVRDEADADNIIVERGVLPDKFYKTESDFAGMIKQKLISHKMKMAVVGDPENNISNNEGEGDILFFKSVNDAIAHFV